MDRPQASPEQPEPRSERHARRRAEVRRRLLDQGLKLIGGQGVQATKVEEITALVGVGKGTFFTHFASKEQFVAELVEVVLSDLARRVRPVGLHPSDAESLVAGVGAVHLRYFQLRPEAAALVNQAASLDMGGEAGEAIRERMRAHLEMVAAMIAPAAGGLGWPPERVDDLALMILAVSCGYFSLGGALDRGLDTPAGLLDKLGRALARGLAGGAAG